LLYALKHSNLTAAVHTSFGALFLLVIALHIRNNARSLGTYGRTRRRELAVACVATAVLLGGVVYELPGFGAIYSWGNALRAGQENRREDRQAYQYLETNPAATGAAFELEVKKGKAFAFPAFAVWLEDDQGRFVETLYLSEGIAHSRLLKNVGGEWVPGEVRRPEALPVWGHRRGLRAPDGYYLPDAAHPIADAVTGATPTESWVLRTHASARATRFTIYFEVNQSYDWNDYYSESRFPDDPIYSGTGSVGQPSVVYAAAIDLAAPARYYALNPVGHGHPGGGDGLDPDLSKLTTALDIVDGVLLRVVAR